MKNFLARNANTGLYFKQGEHFTAIQTNATALDAVELALVRASYDNVVGEVSEKYIQETLVHLGQWKYNDGTAEHSMRGWTQDEENFCQHPPLYCHDLNAVHELEKYLGLHKDSQYWQELIIAVGLTDTVLVACANAKTRCNAILRRFNKI